MAEKPNPTNERGDTAELSNVPLTPLVNITLSTDGEASVDGSPVEPVDEDQDARTAALAEVRIKAARRARPVRANAYEPDGTVWPIIVEPDGAVTALEEPHPTTKPSTAPASQSAAAVFSSSNNEQKTAQDPTPDRSSTTREEPHSEASAQELVPENQDLSVDVATDGSSVRILGKEIPSRGNVVDTVLTSLAAFARAARAPIQASVNDHRPGGYRQLIRVYENGRSDLIWAAGENAGPPTSSPTSRTSGGRTGESSAQEHTANSTPERTTPPPTEPPPQPMQLSGEAGTSPTTPTNATQAPPGLLPTVNDLLDTHGTSIEGSAKQGWRRLLNLPPNGAEQQRRASRRAVQRGLDGPRTIVVINPKGGAHKTTATLLLAAAFGTARGGYTLAWDNNETRGTMGWRSLGAAHQRNAIHLLRDVDRLTNTPQVSVGDLDAYVRPQGDAQFDVLASDESPDSWSVVDDAAFRQLHSLLRRFYRVLVVDTGNNMRAANWTAAIDAADALVVVSTIREDTAASAAWMIDALRNSGHHQKIANAVTILSAPGPKADKNLASRLTRHFEQHTRAVVRVPYDRALVDGDQTLYTELASPTRDAWLQAAAAISEGI